MRYQTIWFRAGKAYLPTIGSPPSGMFFEVDPVEAMDPTADSIQAAVTAALRRPVTVLRERSRFDPDWPKQSVVQVAAGYKSWKVFVHKALRISLVEAPDGWHVTVGEGSSPQDVEDVRMPATSTPAELAERVREVASRRKIWQER